MQQKPGPFAYRASRYGAGGIRKVLPFLRPPSSCQDQPFGALLRAASARAKRSARMGCARQYESIASLGVGGTNGRLSARSRTADRKISANLLVSRAMDRPLLSASA